MLEARMTEMAAADAPAAHDPVFTYGVMARIAKRRQRGRLVAEGALVVGGSLALAAAMPLVGQLAPLLEELARGAVDFSGLVALTALVTAVGLVPAWWVMRRSGSERAAGLEGGR